MLSNSNNSSSIPVFSHAPSPLDADKGPLKEISTPYSTLGSRKHGFPDSYAITSPSQNKQFAEDGGSYTNWHSETNSYMDVGRFASPGWKTDSLQKTQHNLEKMGKNVHAEHNTVGYTGQDWGTNVDKVSEDVQSFRPRPSFGMYHGSTHKDMENFPKQDVSNLMDSDQLQIAQKEKLIQRSCALIVGQGLPRKGGVLQRSDAVTNVLLHNIEFSKDPTLCFQEKGFMDSNPTGIVQGPSVTAYGSVAKSSRPYANEQVIASTNISGIIEQESGSIGCTVSKHSDAQASGPSSTTNSQQKNQCGSKIFKTMPPSVIETKENFYAGVTVNNVQNEQSVEDFKCDVDSSHADKVCSNTSLLSKVVPSSNSCQLLISSIYNLSRVLLTSRSKNCTNDFVDIDSGALENSIYMLSHSLLKRLPDNSSGACCEPIMKTQQNQEQLQGQKKVSQNSNEGNDHTESKAQGICLERDRKVIEIRKLALEAGSPSVKKHLMKPRKELLDLQGELLKLQEDVAYERSESNAIVSIYKKLWREAQDGLSTSRSEIMKTKAELDGLKQMLRNLQKHLGGCDESGSKALEPGYEGFEDSPPSDNCEEDQLSHTNTKSESEGKSDFSVILGKSLPNNQEVLTEYFGPVKSVEVDLKASTSFPDIKEVISRFSVLQAREDCSNMGSKAKTTSDSHSKSGEDFPANIDKGVAQRLRVLLSRQAIDLNRSFHDRVHSSGCPSDLDKCSGLAYRVQTLSETKSSDVPQVPVCLRGETPCVGSIEVDSNPISEKVGDDILNSGSWDGQLEVGEECASVLIGSSQVNDDCPNSQKQQTDEAALVQDGECKPSLNPSLQGETEIICLRASDAEICCSYSEGDSEWEVLVSGP